MDSDDDSVQMSAELALAGAVLPGLLQHAGEATILPGLAVWFGQRYSREHLRQRASLSLVLSCTAVYFRWAHSSGAMNTWLPHDSQH